MTVESISHFAALVVTGLAAGLLFGWMVSVLPGLARIDDRTYVATMQTINREIINPAFLATFFLPPVLLGLAAVLTRGDGSDRAVYLGLAAVIYLIGVLGVTVAGNVPLNNSLDAFDLQAVAGSDPDSTEVTGNPELAHRRRTYETPWNRWHALRTAASVVALGLASAAGLVERATAL